MIINNRNEVRSHLLFWNGLGGMIAATLFAFAPTYLSGVTFSQLSVTALVHFHTSLIVIWILMLFLQGWLISARRYQIHRFIGRSSFVIVPFIVVSTLLVTIETPRRKPEIIQLDARIEIYTWGQIIPFVVAWALALMYRRQTAIHARYMVSTVFAAGSAIVFGSS